MSLALHTAPLAFRRGQLDALGRAWLSCPALYSAEMRACLALRTLGRAWVQYREDRAIATGCERTKNTASDTPRQFT